MKTLDEIRLVNGTPRVWLHRPIVSIDGCDYYEEQDGSRTLCPWEEATKKPDHETNSTEKSSANTVTTRDVLPQV